MVTLTVVCRVPVRHQLFIVLNLHQPTRSSGPSDYDGVLDKIGSVQAMGGDWPSLVALRKWLDIHPISNYCSGLELAMASVAQG
jgi:hypothetical protein